MFPLLRADMHVNGLARTHSHTCFKEYTNLPEDGSDESGPVEFEELTGGAAHLFVGLGLGFHFIHT